MNLKEKIKQVQNTKGYENIDVMMGDSAMLVYEILNEVLESELCRDVVKCKHDAISNKIGECIFCGENIDSKFKINKTR